MNQKTMVGAVLLIGLLALSGCTSRPTEESKVTIEKTDSGGTITTTETPAIETIEYVDENTTGQITKNITLKTAEISLQSKMPIGTPIGNAFDSFTLIVPLFGCRLMTVLFFDEEGLNNFNETMKEFNPNQEPLDRKNHPLFEKTVGYTVTRVDMEITNSNTNEKAASCSSTGKEKEKNQIIFYEPYKTVYENLKESDNGLGDVANYFTD